MHSCSSPDQYLQTAITALASKDDWRAALDGLDVPIYTTDAQGTVTYCNQACVPFAGREPKVGEDKWCVTWQIYTTAGEFMPHDQCPMAQAIHKREAIRGAVAIAMRPDGSRRAFTPYPTPLFDTHGELSGAINMLVDVSGEQAVVLGEQAARCDRLARWTDDPRASSILKDMAVNYQANAKALRDR